MMAVQMHPDLGGLYSAKRYLEYLHMESRQGWTKSILVPPFPLLMHVYHI